jgi:Ca-activated chloride channel family protein
VPFILGLFGLGLTLLDYRGPERLVEAQKQEKSMVILIDNSQSMLCEDVRPNRLSKAVMLARHLVKNSFQTKISVMLFSEEVKKLVPFTTDRDLIDARLMSLQDRTELPSGGTRLKQAMREALQELFVQSGDQGSIVVLSDAEGWDESFTLSTSKNVHVAFIAVGTAKGGPIPLRDKRGRFIDHKRVGSEIVTTALNEKFLADLSKDLPNYKYWVANSYSLPTEEVLSFLSQSAKISDQKSLTRNRDSYFDYFLTVSVLLLISSLIMRRIFISFVPLAFTLMLLVPLNLTNPVMASAPASQQVNAKAKPKPKPTFSPKTLEYLKLWQKGELSDLEKKDLALDLLNTNFPKQALSLYMEIQGNQKLNGDLVDVWNNGAVAKAQDKDYKGGLKRLIELQGFLHDANQLIGNEKNSTELRGNLEKLQQLVRENILALTIKQEQQQQQQQKQDQEKNEEQEKQEQEQQQNNSSENNNDQESSEGKENKEDQKQQDEKEQEKDQQKQESEKDKEDENNTKKDQQQDQQKPALKPEDYKQLPAILKQLMNEDRDLQRTLIDTSTKEKGVGHENDW